MRNREWILPVLIMAVILLAAVPCSGDETRTITDLTGNKVIIPANVTRAVNIDPFSGQFIYIIGADRKLVGTTLGPADKDRLNITEPYLISLPSAGHKDNLNKEELMLLKPDVVISSVDYVNANDVSKQLGIPFVILDFETPENLIKSYKILGEIFGKEKEAGEFIKYYTEKMNQIKSDLAIVTDEKKKSVYFGQRKPTQTLGDDYYEASIAGIAGADNVAEGISGGDNVVSMDQIYLWNPDVIILLPYCSGNISSVLADPAWQALPAVKNRQVYRMPKYLMTWEMPVPESVLATMWLEKVLYPEYASFDMQNEIKDFYKKFYRLSLTDENVTEMLTNSTPVLLTSMM